MPIASTPGAVTGGSLGVQATETISLNGTKIWSIPPRIGTLTIQAVPVGVVSSFQVYVTADSLDEVEAGTATWFEVFSATQSAAVQQAIFASVSAVKFAHLAGAGTLKCTIRGQ